MGWVQHPTQHTQETPHLEKPPGTEGHNRVGGVLRRDPLESRNLTCRLAIGFMMMWCTIQTSAGLYSGHLTNKDPPRAALGIALVVELLQCEIRHKVPGGKELQARYISTIKHRRPQEVRSSIWKRKGKCQGREGGTTLNLEVKVLSEVTSELVSE